MPYLVGESIGAHRLEVQVGLEQLQEAVIHLLHKTHILGFISGHLPHPSFPLHLTLVCAWESHRLLSKGHHPITAGGSECGSMTQVPTGTGASVTSHSWEKKPPQTGAAAYLAVLELEFDLGVIDHLAQIPDNRFPPSLLEQAGEPLVQVLLLVFLVLNTLYQEFRIRTKSEPVG